MGKKLTTTQSRPLVVDTQYAPPSASFVIKSVGDQSLDQWYDPSTSTYKPDRASSSPLVLKPVLTIYDPDGILPSQPSSFKKVEWREIVENALGVTDNGDVTAITDTVVIGGQTVRVYTQASDGTLTVRRNVPPGTSYRLRCSLTYVDTRTGYDINKQAEAMLITSAVEEAPCLFVLTTPDSYEYHPLLNSVSNGEVVVNNITFGAELYRADQLESDAKYFWYWISPEHPEGVLVDDATNPCGAYVSGQGTSSVVINPDLAEDLSLMVRAADNQEATEPNVNDRQYFSMITVYDPVSSDTVCYNGQNLYADMGSMTFGQLIKLKGKDIDPAIRRQYLSVHWYHKLASSNTVTDDGYGDEITHQRSVLSSAQGDSVLVYAEIEIRGAYQYVVQDGAYVVQDGAYVVSRS